MDTKRVLATIIEIKEDFDRGAKVTMLMSVDSARKLKLGYCHITQGAEDDQRYQDPNG